MYEMKLHQKIGLFSHFSYQLTRSYSSAFYAIVKIKTLNSLIQSEDYIKTFKAIGDRIAFNPEQFTLTEQFVCKLLWITFTFQLKQDTVKEILFKKEIILTPTVTSDA